MDNSKWVYEKLGDDGKIKTIADYTNDANGEYTGRHIINVKAWFDENPEERKRLGWIKHIEHSQKEIAYNPQTQFVITTNRQVDEWTIKDELHVIDKSEDQLAFEEMLSVAWGGTIVFGAFE